MSAERPVSRESRRGAGADGWTAEAAPAFDFPVRFTRGALEASNPELLAALRRREPFERHRVLFLIDDGLEKARPGTLAAAAAYLRSHGGSLVEAAAPLLVPGGRGAKEGAALAGWLRARFLAAGLDGRGHVVAAGGGALLDAAGHAAATTRGGLRLTRMPSTLAAQACSCVSLTAGVDELGRADAVSGPAVPFAVIVDFGLLGTLRPRQRAAGLACAARAALLRDPAFFHWLCDRAEGLARAEPEALEACARWSLRLHLQEELARAARWERPGGEPFDLGGWAGRRLQRLSGGRLEWGEALGIGMALDVILSNRVAGLDDSLCDSALDLLGRLGLRLWHRTLERRLAGRALLLAGLDDEQERRNGVPGLELLADLGRARQVPSVSDEQALESIQELKRRTRRHP